MNVPISVKKIRTFRDDVARVRGASTNKAELLNVKEHNELPIVPQVKPVGAEPERSSVIKPVVYKKTVPPPTSPSIQKTEIAPEVKPAPRITKSALPTLQETAGVKPLQDMAVEISSIKTTPDAPSGRINERDLNVMETDSVVHSGSIISDKKKDRFHLLSATWEALVKWIQSEKQGFERRAEQKRRAIPTVRPAEERKEILKKAAVKTAQAPKDDHAKVKSVRPVALNVVRPAAPVVNIKSKEAVPKPSWTHFAEPIDSNHPAPKPVMMPTTPVSQPPVTKESVVDLSSPASAAIDLPPVEKNPDEIKILSPIEKPQESGSNSTILEKGFHVQPLAPKTKAINALADQAAEESAWSHFVETKSEEGKNISDSSLNKNNDLAPITHSAAIEQKSIVVPPKVEKPASQVPAQTVKLQTEKPTPVEVVVELPQKAAVATETAVPIPTENKTSKGLFHWIEDKLLHKTAAPAESPKTSLEPPDKSETPTVAKPEPVKEPGAPAVAVKKTAPPTMVATPDLSRSFQAPATSGLIRQNITSLVKPVIGVAVLSTVLGVGLAWILFDLSGPEAPAPSLLAPALIQSDQRVTIQLEQNLSNMERAMSEVVARTSESIILFDISVGESAATNEQIYNLLNLRAPASFARSVTDINFGRYHDKPFIVMKINSFDNGFGGMLEAEPNLAQDLSVLYDPGTEQAFLFNQPFVNDTIKNHDLRVLYDSRRREYLVYGFVNLNTMIIAADRDSFAVVAEMIK